MRKIFCGLVIIASLFYLIGCIGSLDRGVLTLTDFSVNAVISLLFIYAGFFCMEKRGSDRR